jgi:hypothetical protein
MIFFTVLHYWKVFSYRPYVFGPCMCVTVCQSTRYGRIEPTAAGEYHGNRLIICTHKYEPVSVMIARL